LSKVPCYSHLSLNPSAQHRVHRTSAGAAHTFGDSGPNGGFGVWRFFPPNPALAGNACRWAVICDFIESEIS
jgi:hypothetical protein